MLNKEGYATELRRYDEYGNQIEMRYLGLDGKPTLHKDGYAGWRSRFDDRGNQVERAFFGLDGKPTTDKDGTASWRALYDDRGSSDRREQVRPLPDLRPWPGQGRNGSRACTVP
jgi:hypothetical protein